MELGKVARRTKDTDKVDATLEEACARLSLFCSAFSKMDKTTLARFRDGNFREVSGKQCDK